MSLITRTSSTLFTKIGLSDPEEVAVEFAGQYRDDVSNSNIQLIDLIFRCCGVFRLSSHIPFESIRNENVDEIMEFVEFVSTDLLDDIYQSTFVQYSTRSLTFFERFWSLIWSDDGNEETSFIQQLLLALSSVDQPKIQFFCVRIRAKYVTSLVKNKPDISLERMRKIQEYACNVMASSHAFKHKDLLESNLRELGIWLERRPAEFMVDNSLRDIIFAVKDLANDVILLALEIVESLLKNHSERLPPRFLKECGKTFLTLDFVESGADEIFARVCSCCRALRNLNLDNVVPPELEKVLLDPLYSGDENKWEAAGDYWIAINYDPDPFQYLRNVIKSAPVQKNSSSTLQFVNYFVDALVAKCAVLTNWHLCAEVLTGCQLNADQGPILLVLIIRTAERVITNRRPKLRNTRENNNFVDMEAAQEFTLALLPHLEAIFKLEFADPALLLKLATFFHFDSLPTSTKKNLIRFCELTFQQNANFMVRRIAVQLLMKINTNDSDDGIKNRCMTSIGGIKTLFENKVRRKFNNFLQDPVPTSIQDRTLSEDLLALRFIDGMLPVEKDIAFDFTIALLGGEYGAEVSDPLFFAVQEILSILSVKFLERALNNAEEIDEVCNNAKLSGIYLSQRLKKLRKGSGFGYMPVFYSLCDIAVMLKRKEGVILPLPSTVLKSLRIYFLKAYPELSNADQRRLMDKYLSMINKGVLTMEYAYDAVSAQCNFDNDDSELLLTHFLEAQNEQRDTDSMVGWMIEMWMRIYKDQTGNDEGEKNLWLCGKICELIYPIRSSLSPILYKCHVMGIDYATSEAMYSGFFKLLTVFSRCLNLKDRERVLEYIGSKVEGYLTEPIVQYVSSLEATKPLSATIDDSSFSVSTGQLLRSPSGSFNNEDGPSTSFSSVENTYRFPSQTDAENVNGMDTFMSEVSDISLNEDHE